MVFFMSIDISNNSKELLRIGTINWLKQQLQTGNLEEGLAQTYMDQFAMHEGLCNAIQKQSYQTVLGQQMVTHIFLVPVVLQFNDGPNQECPELGKLAYAFADRMRACKLIGEKDSVNFAGTIYPYSLLAGMNYRQLYGFCNFLKPNIPEGVVSIMGGRRIELNISAGLANFGSVPTYFGYIVGFASGSRGRHNINLNDATRFLEFEKYAEMSLSLLDVNIKAVRVRGSDYLFKALNNAGENWFEMIFRDWLGKTTSRIFCEQIDVNYEQYEENGRILIKPHDMSRLYNPDSGHFSQPLTEVSLPHVLSYLEIIKKVCTQYKLSVSGEGSVFNQV